MTYGFLYSLAPLAISERSVYPAPIVPKSHFCAQLARPLPIAPTISPNIFGDWKALGSIGGSGGSGILGELLFDAEVIYGGFI
jgi:hypothetical protein